MDRIWYSLLVGLVALLIGAILSYIVEGKINWIPTVGPAIGVFLVVYLFGPKTLE